MSKIYNHSDQFVIDYLRNNPELPYLISYPRTGSHWIRYVMEMYFEKPSLVVLFNYDNANDYTCYHIHFVDINTPKNVIYLYRNAVDTIYSIMKYYKEDLNNRLQVQKYLNEYCNHIQKWMINNKTTKNIIYLKYDNFKEDFINEFEKLCVFFNKNIDKDKLKKIINKSSKENVANATGNIYSKINCDASYLRDRENFKTKYLKTINNFVKEKKMEKYI